MTAIGYARVSTLDQDPQLQLDALSVAGCERIYVDRASGSRADRPELAAALDYLRPGDTLVVWRLDRLGRSLSHLLATLDSLTGRGVRIRSLSEGMDTETAEGRLLAGLLGAFAEFERSLVRERTRAGLAAARALGRRGGRRRVLSAAQIRAARTMRAERVQVAQIARSLGCSRATVYRATAV